MDHMALAMYFLAFAIYLASPGPVMAVLVARSVGSESRSAPAFAAGLCSGYVVAVCAVALGIGVWAQSSPEWFSLAKYAGVAYLMWLAVRMWNTRSALASAGEQNGGRLASAGAGLALCLGNPSTLLIYMLLLPGVAPAGIANPGQMVLVGLVTLTAAGAVFFGTVLLARQINRLIASPSSLRRFNQASAVMIAITSVWILVA